MNSAGRQKDGKPCFTEQHIPRDHGQVYARDYEGSGPTFVLMHGSPTICTFMAISFRTSCKAGAGSLRSISWGSARPTSRRAPPTASNSNSAIWKRS